MCAACLRYEILLYAHFALYYISFINNMFYVCVSPCISFPFFLLPRLFIRACLLASSLIRCLSYDKITQICVLCPRFLLDVFL